jgi:signal transduction histidine kinase
MDDPCLARWGSAARQALIEAITVRGLRGEDWLEARRRGFALAFDKMRARHACIDREARPELAALEEEIGELLGEQGTFQLRRLELDLAAELETQLGRGQHLGEQLIQTVETQFRGARLNAERANQDAQTLVQRHRLLLIGLFLLLLCLILLAYFYLHRALLAPISDLIRALRDPAGTHVAAFPVARDDEIGDIIHVVQGFVIERDRRERELATAKQQAEAANRTKTQFLASMSHDLRTPLNAILGYAELLGHSPRLDAEERGQCQTIRRSGKQLLRLIDGLLDIAAIEAGKVEPLLALLDLDALLEDLVVIHRPLAEAKGLEFVAEIACDPSMRLLGDGQRIQQVVQNLLENAVKYTDQGVVRLSAELLEPDANGHWLGFVVEDTGPGIPPEHQRCLFEPFKQMDHARDGAGLGLAICRRITTLLDARLTLESEPGRGCRFRFQVPVRMVPTPSVSERSARAAAESLSRLPRPAATHPGGRRQCRQSGLSR